MKESSNEGVVAIAKLFVWVFSIFLLSIPLWIIWNDVIPVVFNLPKITYIQAAGIMFIAQFLRVEIHSSNKKKGGAHNDT